MSRILYGGIAAASITGFVMALAMPEAEALAHVKVTADHPQAGASNVTVTFTAEAESENAGILSLETTLPKGVAPDDVSLVSGPSGWKLRPTEKGFKFSGPARPVGEDVTFSVILAKVPNNAKR